VEQLQRFYNYYARSSNEELGQVNVRGPGLDYSQPKSVIITELEFDTPTRKPEMPITFGLGLIYPNPFNSRTTVTFSIPESQVIQLMLYDALGRRLSTLVSGHSDRGVYHYSLDASSLPTGTYIISLVGFDAEVSEQLQLIK
jgi:hypothetical protein